MEILSTIGTIVTIETRIREFISNTKKRNNEKDIENIELVESAVEEESIDKKYEIEMEVNYIDPNFLIYNNYTTKLIWEITYNGDMKQCIDCETGKILEDEITYEEKKD